MTEPLQGRVNERRSFEELVNIVVDKVYKDFGDDLNARLRLYDMVAENFAGLARSLRSPVKGESVDNG